MPASILMPDLKYRNFWLFMGFVWIALDIYLSLMHNPPQILDVHMADKIEHFAAYALLMFWFCQIFWEFSRQLKVAIALAALGVSMEIVQGMEGFRVFEYADMLANTIGVLIGWGVGKTVLKHTLCQFERVIVR
ncbi:VanZ family protein [Sulfurirhabdus autotrophica]|uniref:VanZ like protein n=1 Tax=Sulfurirhabdus autotrophica TaxID=1706046 RepID=A0A4R3XSH1_9PROT|nr:VanZ family protein [Sulfurirhabdus autotrophica]TCV81292.1 VanZ like protein [Sulfurirhabdus autotrophica]